jgi:hypothetical protein
MIEVALDFIAVVQKIFKLFSWVAHVGAQGLKD